MNIRHLISKLKPWRRTGSMAWKSINGVHVTIAATLGYLSYLSIGPAEIEQFLFPPQRSMEEVIRDAERDSVEYTVPSSEALVVKVMHHTIFDTALADEKYVLLSQVSPFQPVNMGTVFRGGDRCRFLGEALNLATNERDGYVEITEVSCVDDRGTLFTLSADSGRRLGFVTNVGDTKSTAVHTVKVGKQRALRQFDDVVIRFDKPIMALVNRGNVRSL
ncbi:hypothetical protein EI533_25290 [Pseudomonas donghuensis]|nr:hypothetical protein [Pseudomonas donghuensis]